jgi:CBS domain-containing protein
MTAEMQALLERQHPYDLMGAGRIDEIVAASPPGSTVEAGATVVRAGAPLPGPLCRPARANGAAITDENGTLVSELGPGNSFGERGLLRGGASVTTAEAIDRRAPRSDTGSALFRSLFAAEPAFRRFFDRSGEARGAGRARPADLTTIRVADLMARPPVTCTPRTPLVDAARLMRDRRISCLCVIEDERLVGIVTVRDFTNRGVAAPCRWRRPWPRS